MIKIGKIQLYTKTGEETGRKLYSCDKNIWFATISIAVRVHEDRLKREQIREMESEHE